MHSPGNEREPALENDYRSDDTGAPSSHGAQASSAMAQDNQQDVRITHHAQALRPGRSMCMHDTIVCMYTL